jgi:hypothetical protein
MFTAHPSSWTRLDCKKGARTRACLKQVDDASYLEDVPFLLAVPHIGRLRTPSVSRNLTQLLQILVSKRDFFVCFKFLDSGLVLLKT